MEDRDIRLGVRPDHRRFHAAPVGQRDRNLFAGFHNVIVGQDQPAFGIHDNPRPRAQPWLRVHFQWKIKEIPKERVIEQGADGWGLFRHDGDIDDRIGDLADDRRDGGNAAPIVQRIGLGLQCRGGKTGKDGKEIQADAGGHGDLLLDQVTAPA